MIESWVSIYANQACCAPAVSFLHIAGLVGGGGCAIAADLATITAVRDGVVSASDATAPAKRTHRIVVLGLVAPRGQRPVAASRADVETFLYSRIFWLKMGLMVLLISNGLAVVRGERRVQDGDPACVDAIAQHGRGQPRAVVLDDARRRRPSQHRMNELHRLPVPS